MLKLLQQPLNVHEYSDSDELDRDMSLRSEFLNLPDRLTNAGAARRFRFEALCLSSMLLEQYGKSDAALESLTTARKSMLKSATFLPWQKRTIGSEKFTLVRPQQ